MGAQQILMSLGGGSGGGGLSVPSAKTILNFNGADASTTITDDTGNHTWTLTSPGGGAIDTSKSKFGGSSFQILSSDRVTAPSHAAWAFPASTDFTVACWIWIPSSFAGQTGIIFMSNTSSGLLLAYRADKLTIGREGIAYDRQSTNNIPLDQWVHVEAGRAGSTDYGFINGALEFTGGNTHNYAQAVASFGAKADGSAALTSSWMDSSLVAGSCLHTSAFTPPTLPYAP